MVDITTWRDGLDNSYALDSLRDALEGFDSFSDDFIGFLANYTLDFDGFY